MTDTTEFDTDKITTEQAREAVAKGAALLDKRNPGWDAKIDLEILHIGHLKDCVLGQLYGDYWSGQRELGLNDTRSVIHGLDTWTTYGKLTHPQQFDMGDLQTAWEELINERRFK